jgi:DNA polymerase III sliding clamp (beta) subunit (PCNA family)|nr:MAG TPA: beta sliding clamp [Caudoviricetes sp.]
MKSAKIYTNDLNRLIAATKSFVGNSDHRPCNQYIKLEFHAADSQVVAMAVDGYRMSVEHSIISDCDEDFVAFIKSNTKLPSKQYATISLTEDGKEAVIRCCGFSFGYTQPQDSGFEWEKAIPTSEVKYRIGFNGNYLLAALQAAKVSAGESFRQPVILEFRSNVEPILLRTNKEDIKMVMPVRLKEEAQP